MPIDIRLPNITGQTEREQLAQVKSYLYQFAEQLNWALNTSVGTSDVTSNATKAVSQTDKVTDAQDNFNEIKSLIIKSADIVNAYYDVINAKLSGIYVASSDFGTYKNQTESDISANSSSIETAFSNISTIKSNVTQIHDSLVSVNAHIKCGMLYEDENGAPIYGVEVGQKNVVEGVETFNKYARFRSNRLSFYDQNGTEVAYISDYKLYITNAEITGTLVIGKYKLDTSNGIAFKWLE